MTTKRKAQPRKRGKAGDERTPEQLMCVSVEEAERLIATLADAPEGALYDDDGAIGALLLLLHSAAYADEVTRGAYLCAAEKMLLPYTDAFSKASAGLLEETACGLKSDALKKGGA